MCKTLIAILILTAGCHFCLAQSESYPLQIGDEDHISGQSWSPRNDLIVTTSGLDNGLRLWNVSTGRLLWKSDLGFLQDDLEVYSIRHFAWTRDQKLIATGTDNGKLQLWDAVNGRLIWNIRAHADTVTALAVSPDGKTLVSAADLGNWKSELKAWRLSDGKLLKDLSAGQRDIRAISFTDKNHFKTGNGAGQITTWSTNKFVILLTRQVSTCGSQLDHTKIVYSPDFSHLAAQCKKKLLVRNTNTARVVQTIQQEPGNFTAGFSKNNAVVLLPRAEVLDLRTGRKRELQGFEEGVLNDNGSLVAAEPSYRANGVQIFDTSTGQRRAWLMGHPGAIKSLAFSHDGRRFASGSADRIVRIWDTQTQKILFSLDGHTDEVESVQFTENDLTLISRSEEETITWDAERGTKLRVTTKKLHFSDSTKVSLSPSGKLGLVEEYEKPFRLINAETNELIREFVFIDQLDNMIFCPDEKHFLVKPWWKGWQLWHIEGNKPIREFDIGYSFYNRVAFHPDGRRFITGGEGQNIFMFDLETGEKIWGLFPIDQEEFDSKKASEARRVASIKRNKERARLADIETEQYNHKVYITFSHYGDMIPLGEQRIGELDTPNKSKIRKSAADASAIWLRLHNDSPLPISVPTQSMYLPNRKCFYEFPDKQKIFGLCNNREISVWLGLENKNGEPVPYGFDFGSSVRLLPGTSVLFGVDHEILQNGNAIRFSFTFQNLIDEKKIDDYGTPKLLKFRESDLPKQ